ncbi:hypothetical protein G6F68_018356 [Rhizopus microsporus]|nr:hypothetical protein G6F68_018356 [Rhizopus microsporus]
MPMDCPSSTGKGRSPKSSTMWWISLSVSAPGCAADHGGTDAPADENEAGAAGTGVSARAARGSSPAPASTASGKAFSPGNSSQPNWSCTEYASARSTSRQLSIDPVGHGGTQAMQPLQISGSTT